jgi:periplasmic protein CpxP/Spy
MFDAISRAARNAAVIGMVGALAMLPLGVVPAQAGAGDGASLQLAQAGPGRGGAAPAGGSDVDRQIADLKKQLKITPQQEPQFNAFADVMRNNAQDEDAQMRQAGANQHPNAVDGLKQAQQMAETQSNGLKRLVPAFQALYDSLSDSQKKVADQVLGGGEEPGGPPQGGAPASKRR